MVCFTSYPKEDKFTFNISAQDMLDKITPPLGAEFMNPIFGKYGYTLFGIGDGWKWITKDIPEIDIWHMAALCNLYWCNFYEYLNAKKDFEEYKQYVEDKMQEYPEFEKTYNLLEKSQKEDEEARIGGYTVKDGMWVKM